MRAGVAASRKVKPKKDAAKLNNTSSNPHPRSSSKTRRPTINNATSKDEFTDVNRRSDRKTATPIAAQHSIKNEYCVTSNSLISNLASERDSLLRHKTGNGSVTAGAFTQVPLQASPPSDCPKLSPQVHSATSSEKTLSGQKKSLTIKVACSADAFVAAGAAAKGGERLAQAKRNYYRKAIALMVVGGLIFTLGIALAALYFAGYPTIQMAGPICLSIGLLLGVCGIVWIPIIKTKLKRQQQVMTRTFS